MDKTKENKEQPTQLASNVATEFYNQSERAGKVLNQEGGELNDIVLLKSWAAKLSKMKTSDSTDDAPKYNYWLPVVCEGSMPNVSLTNLVGTSKRTKYFPTPSNDDERFTESTDDSGNDVYVFERPDGGVTTYVKDFADYENILTLPKVEIEAATAVEKYFGRKLKRIAIAENCGRFDQTFNLWAVID